MPSGRTHRRLWKNNLWLAFAVSALVLVYDNQGAWLVVAFTIPLGYLLGYLVDPDLDLMTNTEAKKRWKKTIILYPIALWWTLYALVAKRFLGGHRSFWTHFPVVSTSLRFLWLLLPFIIVGYIAGTTPLTGLYMAMLIGVLLGLSVADTVHFVADLR